MDGYMLKSMRTDRGFSLNKLSQLTGISKSYLSLIERDIQRNPSLDVLEKLAQSFNIEVEDLVKKNNNDRTSIKGYIKVEIELSEEHLNPLKLQQIKDLLHVIIND